MASDNRYRTDPALIYLGGAVGFLGIFALPLERFDGREMQQKHGTKEEQVLNTLGHFTEHQAKAKLGQLVCARVVDLSMWYKLASLHYTLFPIMSNTYYLMGLSREL